MKIIEKNGFLEVNVQNLQYGIKKLYLHWICTVLQVVCHI